ncbi:MAG: TetR/AcrR family transcriptional regulator [Bacillota bacterium]
MGLEQFTALPEEKRRKIIDAAMVEFIEHGYDAASTNRIIDRAGISKGVLFKYFGSKEGLYLFLAEKMADEKVRWMAAEGVQLPDGLFAILKFFTVHELSFLENNRQHYYLYRRIRENPTHPINAKILTMLADKSSLMLRKITELLPTEELREGVTLVDLLRLIGWISEGYAQENQIDIEVLGWKDKLIRDWDQIFFCLQYGLSKREDDSNAQG